jgi:hypothetical protein
MKIAFMNLVILYRFYVTHEYWYVRFVLIAGHVFLFSLMDVTICDIWAVVGVSSITNAIYGTGPYLPSLAFVFNSSFNGAPVAQTLVFYCGPLFVCWSFSSWPLSFRVLGLVILMLSSDFPYNYWASYFPCI